jgi:hypothetical protein
MHLRKPCEHRPACLKYSSRSPIACSCKLPGQCRHTVSSSSSSTHVLHGNVHIVCQCGEVQVTCSHLQEEPCLNPTSYTPQLKANNSGSSLFAGPAHDLQKIKNHVQDQQTLHLSAQVRPLDTDFISLLDVDVVALLNTD